MLELVDTADGSKTLYHPGIGEHYHSRHGAVQESKHVFLGMGLCHFIALHHTTSVSILEVGFGTGLNFLLSADYCRQQGIALNYVGIEAHPLPQTLLSQTGYDSYVTAEIWEAFQKNYMNGLQANRPVLNGCMLTIIPLDVMKFDSEEQFDVLYFDAFAAVHQPEMWTAATLQHVCSYLKPGGVFVTYAITGHLKRTLKDLGFTTEKIPGAPGKREMLRATKFC